VAEAIGPLFDLFRERGWQGRIVPASHLGDLAEAVRGRHDRGLLDETLYRETLAWMRFDVEDALPTARSLVIVAVPVPATRIVFRWNGRPLPVSVPPTYAAYSPRKASVQAEVRALLAREGHALADVALPLKTLAVRAGLAAWGRNNIVYVPGMGSFLQLVGAATDLPCPGDSWREPAMLERCERCTACLARCPTGAIPRDRFLLRAERCLTFHNERSVDLPSWIDPSWHHCLIGCMRCQEICPENRDVVGWFEDAGEFSEEETRLLVSRVPLERLPPETAATWRGLALSEPYPDFCRNLAMLVERPTRTV
jgi:epoxyqueuosine reductase